MSWWWLTVPAFVGRFSKMLATVLADGIYLMAWPWVGATAPPSAFLLGFLSGWLQFFGQVFSVSLVGMAVMLLVSTAGSALGVWVLAGYLTGDFILGNHRVYYGSPFSTFVFVRVPLLISYLLLGMLLVVVPWGSARLRRRTLSRFRAERKVRMMVDASVQAVLAALLVFVWTQSTPTLIRPVFTWAGGTPPIEAIHPLQENGVYLAWLAALLSVGRIIAEYVASARPQVRQRVASLRAQLAHGRPSRWQLPAPVHAILKGLFLTFMLAGLLTDWLDAIVFALMASTILIMRFVLSSRFLTWVRMVSHIPILVRIGTGMIASYLIARMVMGAMWSGTSTFRPVTISVTASLLVFAFILPETAVRAQRPPTESGADK